MPVMRVSGVDGVEDGGEGGGAREARGVWVPDRYTAQPGHGLHHPICPAQPARDLAHAVEVSTDPVPLRLQLWVQAVLALNERATDLAAVTLMAVTRVIFIAGNGAGRGASEERLIFVQTVLPTSIRK